MTSEHAETLNVLSDMQRSLVYAVRRKVLADAERIIVEQEKRIKELAWWLAKCLHADNLPTPPIETYPQDEFAEAYRKWYHGRRADALTKLESNA